MFPPNFTPSFTPNLRLELFNPLGVGWREDATAGAILDQNMALIDAALGSGSSSVYVNAVKIGSPNFKNSATVTFSVSGSDVTATAGSGAWAALTGDLTETQVLPWDGDTPGTKDTFLSRGGPGLVCVGTTGTAGDYTGSLKLTTLTFADGTSQTTKAVAQVQTDWNASSGIGVLLNKPSIPAAQVNSDWNSVAGVSQISNKPSLATVATSGSYTDLSSKPSIPAAQVNSDWNASSGVAQISNKPSLATVATSGSYADLSSKPSIPAAQVQTDWNASSGIGVLLNKPSLATVATSGSYADLSSKPSIPAAQVNSDWNASSGVAQILNKPSLAFLPLAGGTMTGVLVVPNSDLEITGATYWTKLATAASANWTLTLPATAGTNLYVLQTDGSGNCSWVAQSGGGSSTLASLTDVTITAPAESDVLHYDSTSSKWINAPLGWYTDTAEASVVFTSDGSSLTGWTANNYDGTAASVSGSIGNPLPSFLFAGGGTSIYRSVTGMVAGCTIQFDFMFDANPTYGISCLFGCTSAGVGPGLSLMPSSGLSGFNISSSWNFPLGTSMYPATTGTASPLFNTSTWYTIKIVIAGNGLSASWYINNTLQGTGTLAGGIQGAYLEFDGGKYTNTANVYFDNISVTTGSSEHWQSGFTSGAGVSTLALSYFGANAPVVEVPALKVDGVLKDSTGATGSAGQALTVNAGATGTLWAPVSPTISTVSVTTASLAANAIRSEEHTSELQSLR